MPVARSQEELVQKIDQLLMDAVSSEAQLSEFNAAGVRERDVLSLLVDVLGKDFWLMEDPLRLPALMARHEGYNIPPFAYAGCGEIKDFFADKGVADVPEYFASVGIPWETYQELYAYELIVARNKSYAKKVFLVSAATLDTLTRSFLLQVHEIVEFIISAGK